MVMIETRKITDIGISIIERLTASKLEEQFRDGDYLYLMGIVFKMVYYSIEVANNQSRFITWWSELYNIEIQIDRINDSVIVETPVIDYKLDGF